MRFMPVFLLMLAILACEPPTDVGSPVVEFIPVETTTNIQPLAADLPLGTFMIVNYGDKEIFINQLIVNDRNFSEHPGVAYQPYLSSSMDNRREIKLGNPFGRPITIRDTRFVIPPHSTSYLTLAFAGVTVDSAPLRNEETFTLSIEHDAYHRMVIETFESGIPMLETVTLKPLIVRPH